MLRCLPFVSLLMLSYAATESHRGCVVVSQGNRDDNYLDYVPHCLTPCAPMIGECSRVVFC